MNSARETPAMSSMMRRGRNRRCGPCPDGGDEGDRSRSRVSLGNMTEICGAKTVLETESRERLSMRCGLTLAEVGSVSRMMISAGHLDGRDRRC